MTDPLGQQLTEANSWADANACCFTIGYSQGEYSVWWYLMFKGLNECLCFARAKELSAALSASLSRCQEILKDLGPDGLENKVVELRRKTTQQLRVQVEANTNVTLEDLGL
jgi:hypothetical protein